MGEQHIPLFGSREVYFGADNARTSGMDWLWGKCSRATTEVDVVLFDRGREERRWQSLSEANALLQATGHRSFDVQDFFPYGTARIDVGEEKTATRLFIGLGMIGAGALLATMWADVPSVNLSARILPGGGVLLSRSFGW